MVCELLHKGDCEGASASVIQMTGEGSVSSVPGMETVVATITGYVDDERSNLIKLVNSCGSLYVGNLKKGSATHLVCWTFYGKKYKLAKKFGIWIVNHRWFEDSVKAQRRLDEAPYTSLSGKDVGAVLWRAPSIPQPVKRGSLQTYAMDYVDPSPPRRKPLAFECSDYVHHSPPRRRPLAFECSEKTIESSDHEDLEVWLQYMRRKKDQGLKYPRKCPKKPISSPANVAERKCGDTRNKVTRSILDYAYIADDVDDADIISTPSSCHNSSKNGTSIEKTSSSRKEKQVPLEKFHSMRHRKKRRLMKDKASFCGFDDKLLGTIDLTCSQTLREVAVNTLIHEDTLASARVDCSVDAVCSLGEEDPHPIPNACTFIPSDIECVICHTDKITIAEGVLACGHRFCFQCIKKWASRVASRIPMCPLCMAPFDIITKRQQKVGVDEEQPFDDESIVLFKCGETCTPEQLGASPANPSCIFCGIGDTSELLLICNGCGVRAAHTFCLDPPLPPIPNTPWFCGRCSQRRRYAI